MAATINPPTDASILPPPPPSPNQSFPQPSQARLTMTTSMGKCSHQAYTVPQPRPVISAVPCRTPRSMANSSTTSIRINTSLLPSSLRSLLTSSDQPTTTTTTTTPLLASLANFPIRIWGATSVKRARSCASPRPTTRGPAMRLVQATTPTAIISPFPSTTHLRQKVTTDLRNETQKSTPPICKSVARCYMPRWKLSSKRTSPEQGTATFGELGDHPSWRGYLHNRDVMLTMT